MAIDWSKLESLLTAGGGLAGLGALSQGQSSLTVGLLLGGGTLFVTVVLPPSKALGRGLERWIDEAMGGSAASRRDRHAPLEGVESERPDA